MINFELSAPRGRYIIPFSDWGFKELFGTDPNKDLLIRLLNELLPGRHIVDVEFLPDDIRVPLSTTGQISLDIYCRCLDGTRIIVEMQNRVGKTFADRMLIYSAVSLLENYTRKRDYYRVCDVVCIAITTENVFPETPKTPVRLALCDTQEERTTIRSDKILEIFVELRKLADSAEAKSPSERDFLEKFSLAMGSMQYCEGEPDELGGDEFFRRMFDAGDLNGYDEDKKQLYRENVMNEFKAKMTLLELTHDAREDGFAEGEAKGKAEGLVEGEAKGAAAAKAETARAMLAEGLTIDLVAKCTGLTTEQITAL